MMAFEHDVDSGDALIDEVRAIRRRLCEQVGNDVDRLVADLRQVEAEYAARRGAFRDVTKDAAAKVLESWGEAARRTDDPIVDEVRTLRRNRGRARGS